MKIKVKEEERNQINDYFSNLIDLPSYSTNLFIKYPTMIELNENGTALEIINKYYIDEEKNELLINEDYIKENYKQLLLINDNLNCRYQISLNPHDTSDENAVKNGTLVLKVNKIVNYNGNLGDRLDELDNFEKELNRIETEISNSIESFNTVHIPVTYMMIDIDFFNKVNDRFGHSTGNVVLKQFVDAILNFTKDYNIITGRWGGEEFVCVCYDIKLDKAKEIADKLRETIAQTEFEKTDHLTCSIGLTELKTGDTSAIVFDRIDQAMYEAKSGGRNCVIVK